MDGSRFGEVTAVSRFWTPQHVDVTDVPMCYAAPKPSWLEQVRRYHVLAGIDERDRSARRRVSTHAVIAPQEIPVLPPLPAAAAVPRRPRGRLRLHVRGWRARADVPALG